VYLTPIVLTIIAGVAIAVGLHRLLEDEDED